MKGFPLREQVERIKEQYPIGTKIKLISIQSKNTPVPSGTEGKVVYIDNVGTLKVQCANGETLGIVVTEDLFEMVSQPDKSKQPVGGVKR